MKVRRKHGIPETERPAKCTRPGLGGIESDANIPEDRSEQIIIIGARCIGARPVPSRLFLSLSLSRRSAAEPCRQDTSHQPFAFAQCAARYASSMRASTLCLARSSVHANQRYWRAILYFCMRFCNVVRFRPRRAPRRSDRPTWPFASSSAFMIRSRSVHVAVGLKRTQPSK